MTKKTVEQLAEQVGSVRSYADFTAKTNKQPMYLITPEQLQAFADAVLMKAAEICDDQRVNAEATGNKEDFAYNNALDHVKAEILALIGKGGE